MALLHRSAAGTGAAPVEAPRLPDDKLVEAEAFPADPFPAISSADRAAAANGASEVFSIEDFPDGVGDLGLTHDDAGGFYNYLAQFTTPNAWFQDANVLSWAYGEDFDNWDDLYGFDSACAVYHSGHGNMDSMGVFQAPMGGEWGGTSWVFSNSMMLGNERARFVFWSTCLSLRVHGGMSPITTWSPANGGLRMLFGFETLSVDNGDYGRFFFEEWNANKSFSQAWLDASWRIDHTQAPTAMACGTDQADAENRLYNERLFHREPASNGWYSWRWYDAAPSLAARPRLTTLPDRLAVAVLPEPSTRTPRAEEVADRFGLRVAPTMHHGNGARWQVLVGDHSHLAVRPDGRYEVRLRPTVESAAAGGDVAAVDPAAVLAAAEDAVSRYGLADHVDLVFDQARHDMVGGGSPDGAGTLIEPRVRETVVHFRQVVNDAPVVTPGRGEVRVSVDASGAVTSVGDSTVGVSDLVDRPEAAPAPAGSTTSYGRPAALDADGIESALATASRRRLRRLAPDSAGAEVTVVPGSTEVGYAMDRVAGTAALVARRTVEVDCGQGLRKRYAVQVPLVG